MGRSGWSLTKHACTARACYMPRLSIVFPRRRFSGAVGRLRARSTGKRARRNSRLHQYHCANTRSQSSRRRTWMNASRTSLLCGWSAEYFMPNLRINGPHRSAPESVRIAAGRFSSEGRQQQTGERPQGGALLLGLGEAVQGSDAATQARDGFLNPLSLYTSNSNRMP